MTILGTIVLWLAFLLSLWGVAVGWVGLRRDRGALLESARRTTTAVTCLLAVAAASLLVALIRRDFNVAYVAAHTTSNLATPYVVAAIAAGWVGKLLVGAFFFSLLLSLRPAVPPGQVVAAAALGLAATATLLAGRPFHRLGITPVEGQGLDPGLLDVGFVLSSTLILLGDAALGHALTHLAVSQTLPGSQRDGRNSSPEAGRWMWASWALVAAGVTLGLWWAYGYARPGGWRRLDPTASGAPATLALAIAGLLACRTFPRRGFSARVAAAGLCLLALAGVGAALGVERQVRLQPGEAVSVGSRLGGVYTLMHTGVSHFQAADRFVTAATLEVRRGGTPMGLVVSERRQYVDALGHPVRDPVTLAGLRRGLIEDVRVVLVDRVAGTEDVVYRVQIHPLTSCAWLGAALLIGGVLLGAFGGA